MKIVTIVGARPQFIKAAVVSRAINMLNDINQIHEIIIHTGQHYDTNMSDVFFSEMNIPKPHFQLHIGGSSHGAMTGRMLEQIEEILLQEKPDLVLVYGDTNSTLAGALSAVKLHIPVAHVEAGLRSFNMNMPEEVNRILTDRVAKLLFCPTDTAIKNLKDEGYDKLKDIEIIKTGDVMYDAALYYRQIAQPSEAIAQIIADHSKKFYLATIHRAENTDDYNRLNTIIMALDEIGKSVPVVLPLHPRTRKLIQANSIYAHNIKFIDPVGYFDMVTLLDQCNGVFTDSGGVQKEAYFFKKPCITLRDETEWVELVEQDYNVLVGANFEKIVAAERKMSKRKLDFSSNLYGDGKAGEKIVKKVVEVLS